MENLNEMEQMSLVDELTQGKELASQLKNQIHELANQLKNQFGPLTSKETCEHLLQQIFSSYDKALSRLKLTELLQKDLSPNLSLVESPESSPKRGCATDHSPRNVSKKRKTLPSWSKKIKVCSGTGLEGPLDDGNSWRKYGQKDILGATHPRAYYRCTHKYTRRCMATKQVQKTEQDPLIFEVIYRGNHTCMDVPNSPSPVVSPEEENAKDVTNNSQLQPEPKQIQDVPSMVGQGLKVEAEKINPKMVRRNTSFSFPSTSIQPENLDFWGQFEENNMLARLISPATSESNYFTGTCQVYPHGLECDLSDMISTPSSDTISLFDLDMDPVEVNIESNLSFDVLDYFTTTV